MTYKERAAIYRKELEAVVDYAMGADQFRCLICFSSFVGDGARCTDHVDGCPVPRILRLLEEDQP